MCGFLLQLDVVRVHDELAGVAALLVLPRTGGDHRGLGSHLVYKIGGYVLLVPLGDLLHHHLGLVDPAGAEEPAGGLGHKPPDRTIV